MPRSARKRRTVDPAVRVEELREQIRRHEHAYYVLDSPEVSDAEYDALFLELRRIEDERRGSGRYNPQTRFGKEFWAEDCAIPE